MYTECLTQLQTDSLTLVAQPYMMGTGLTPSSRQTKRTVARNAARIARRGARGRSAKTHIQHHPHLATGARNVPQLLRLAFAVRLRPHLVPISVTQSRWARRCPNLLDARFTDATILRSIPVRTTTCALLLPGPRPGDPRRPLDVLLSSALGWAFRERRQGVVGSDRACRGAVRGASPLRPHARLACVTMQECLC